MKLIDKDAVLAIIDRLFDKHSSKHDIDEAGVVLLQLRENVESLEVKEVDLQSEIDRVWDNTSDNFSEDGWKEFEDIAKHFFELGVRKKKEEKYEIPSVSKTEDVSVTSRMAMIDDDLKPIAEFILDYAGWNLHKDEWNHPVLEFPLFRVLDALILRGKPYCGKN